MKNDVLRYYNDELSYLRQVGSEFAKSHPKTAGNLRIDNNANADPMVERMLESFAFLTANVQQQFDQDYSELAQNILSILYPESLLPIPSLTTVKFSPSNDLSESIKVARLTEITTVGDKPCRFQTCYDLNLLPVEIGTINYQRSSEVESSLVQVSGSKAYLRLSLNKLNDDFAFDPGSDKLRFYLNTQRQYSNRLYHYIFNHCHQVRWLDKVKQQVGTINTLPTKVGFADNEGLLPLAKSSQQSQKLLLEHSAFPAKYLYFELNNLADINELNNDIELVLCFDAYLPELKQALHEESILLHCTPAINIFKQKSDTISADSHNRLYHLSLDKHDIDNSSEIYRVLSLSAHTEYGASYQMRELFDNNYYQEKDTDAVQWQLLRKPAWHFGGSTGDEVLIQLGNESLTETKAHVTLLAEVLATDRDRASLLPFGGDEPKLRLSEQNSQPYSMRFLTQPTATIRPQYHQREYWQILAYLTGTHDVLSSGQQGVQSLQNLLSLANCAGQEEMELLIDNIQDVEIEHASARYPLAGELCFVPGVQITVTIAKLGIAKQELYLLGEVLSQYLSSHCAVNSFVQLRMVMQQEGEIGLWQPVFGDKSLV